MVILRIIIKSWMDYLIYKNGMLKNAIGVTPINEVGLPTSKEYFYIR